VKTRIGYHHIEYEDWIQVLLEEEPEALTIHGRTRDEMSLVPTHWDVIGEIAHLVKSKWKSNCLVIGNGDVKTLEEADEKVCVYGVDGIMFGRALFGNPWLFQRSRDAVSVEERFQGLIHHTRNFEVCC